MNVEAGPSGATGVAGPASLVGSIVNEGPVSLGDLENTMTIAKFNPVGELAFKPGVPSVLEQAEAVAAKAWEATELNGTDATASSVILSEIAAVAPEGGPRNDNFILPQVEPSVIPVILPIPSTIVEDNVFSVVSPLVEPTIKTGSKIENRVSSQVVPAVSPQPFLQEQEVEEIVMEKVKVEDPKEILEEEEEIEKTNKKFVVDERALSQVVLEIKEAARKAGVLAGKLGIKITGKLIGSFLPAQHPGNESEAVKGKGPDGSIPERQQTIEEQGEYISVVQAEENVVLVAYEKPPIQIRPEGKSVKPEDVDRVFRAHIAKPKAVAVKMYNLLGISAPIL